MSLAIVCIYLTTATVSITEYPPLTTLKFYSRPLEQTPPLTLSSSNQRSLSVIVTLVLAFLGVLINGIIIQYVLVGT